MEQLLCHVFGDYFLQSDYLALNKSKNSWVCLAHVILYTSCFLILTVSWKSLLVIGVTHFLLDRFHTPLRRFIWLRNHLNPNWEYAEYEKCSMTGYYDTIEKDINPSNRVTLTRKIEVTNGHSPRLNYVTIWLYIVHDNFLHLLTNYLAIRYLNS